jgi:molybdopterin-guanine dinucleotide biosynthesis protein B
MAVVAIVGNSGSGKTLLAEQVVAALVSEGVRVAYVKHAPHGFEPGRPGSDSERVRAVGADPVAVLGPDGQLELTVGSGSTDDRLAQLMTGIRGDVVLLEGFRSSPWPKIRVAVVGTTPAEVADPVILDLRRSAGRFSDESVRLAVQELCERRAGSEQDLVTLEADGRDVPLRGFAATVTASTLRGLTRPLRGLDEPAHLRIEVTRRSVDDR